MKTFFRRLEDYLQEALLKNFGLTVKRHRQQESLINSVWVKTVKLQNIKSKQTLTQQ